MAVAIDSANKYRQVIGQLLATQKELLSIDEEYNDLSIGTEVVDSDFPDITAAEFVAGVGAAQIIILAIQTNGTNLYRASDGSQR
jgi:hypothetical protein